MTEDDRAEFDRYWRRCLTNKAFLRLRVKISGSENQLVHDMLKSAFKKGIKIGGKQSEITELGGII